MGRDRKWAQTCITDPWVKSSIGIVNRLDEWSHLAIRITTRASSSDTLPAAWHLTINELNSAGVANMPYVVTVLIFADREHNYCMSAGNYNISVEQYSTFLLPITWFAAGGAVQNLTGFTASLEVKSKEGSVLLTLTSTNGQIALGGIAGTITLSLSASVTSALPPASYDYDLLITDSTGIKTRLLQGLFLVIAGVTPT